MAGSITDVIGLTLTGIFGRHAGGSIPEPWVGTWKFNLAKSQWNRALLKERYPQGRGCRRGALKHTFDGVNAQGRRPTPASG
jgi:hypothetical protein